MRGVEYIEAEDVRRSPFRVAVSPLPSVTSALRDAVGAGRAGTPESWCVAIRSHLTARDFDTLAPFVTSGPLLVPDALGGMSEAPGESFKDAVERMMATSTESLAEEIAQCGAFAGDGRWDGAARDPARWLRRYVASLLRAWKGFGPVWRQARAALDREVERVGAAAALDAQLELLDGLLDRGEVREGRWCIRWGDDVGRFRFPEDGLVLMPMVSGARGFLIGGDPETVAHVGYPVRSTLGLDPEQLPAAALEGLLGVPRAQILRALDCPTSIGRLAEALRAVPSAATHHVSALESAGLVARDRSGRHVLVRRTARGEALLALYDEEARAATTNGARSGRLPVA